MKAPKIIPNYYGYELELNGGGLNNQQKEYFFRCINKIYGKNSRFIYRGDKKDKFQVIYNINQVDDDFYNSLFIMGAKANMFIDYGMPHVNEIDITETGDHAFRLIFRMLGNLMRREFPFGPTRVVMKRFRNTEEEVVAFFRDPENERVFIDRVSMMNIKQKIIVRDYYLALLHHISKSEYYSSSFLLSTTLNFAVAHKFAWKGEQNGSDNPIILCGWVPENYEGVLSVPDTQILRRKIKMDLFNLPVYAKSFFYYQEEITLKGGLLPHYLLGYLHYNDGREVFSINPALFNTDDSWEGVELPIDQSTFHQRIQNTLFGRYFTVDENGQYGQG